MDEIFSSTNPEEGISGAYSIADYLGKIDSSISIITTHYQYLTELEDNTKNFVNYKMPVTKDIINNETRITYPYKLQEGISNQYIALDLLRLKGFDLDIVNKAKAVCNKITKKERKRKKKKEKINKVSLIS
jgi:DNA mismatch repair ATPase MutS